MRIFIARLAGTPVFDPNGDQIGRIRDAVVTLPGPRPPRVHGFVVEVQPRRRVFMPITRVRSFEAGSVVFTGRLDLRRFEQRASETLVLADMLDREVTVRRRGAADDPGVTGSVLDVAMERDRAGDWLLTKVAVRRPGRGLRRGETIVADWEEVTGFESLQPDQGTASLLAAYERMRPADLASALHALPPKRREAVAAALDDDRLADVLEELPERDQIGILTTLAAERAADVLEAMAPDDAADLLQELPADRAQALLELMEPREAAPVRRLLTYAEDTAGGMMTSEPVIVPPTATVAEALAQIRQEDITPAVAAQVYVTRAPYETPTGRFLGVAHFQRLLREPPSSLVGAAIDRTIDPIRPDFSLAEVTSYLATYNLVAAPVVDELGRLVGAVTVDDVLDHLLPPDWREREAEMPAGAEDPEDRKAPETRTSPSAGQSEGQTEGQGVTDGG